MTMGFAVQSLQVDEGGLMQGTLQTSSYNGDWYSLARIYETSKLCMLLFSYELHHRLHAKEAPSHISVMAADPGAVASNILREMPHFLVKLSNLVLMLLTLLQSPTAGAASVVDAALAPWVPSNLLGLHSSCFENSCRAAQCLIFHCHINVSNSCHK
jgi:hypothetical protein